jgi:hypothetical protein
MRAATAAPEPEDEPPGRCFVSQGLSGGGKIPGRTTECELECAGFSDEHATGSHELRRHVGMTFRNIVREQLRVRGRANARRLDVVLQGEWNSVERTERTPTLETCF